MFLVYGVVRGLGQTLPHAIVPQFIGALIGRYYFRKRLGLKWRQYVPVVAAGGDGHCFSLGAGLVRRHTATLTLGTSAVLGVPARRARRCRRRRVRRVVGHARTVSAPATTPHAGGGHVVEQEVATEHDERGHGQDEE